MQIKLQMHNHSQHLQIWSTVLASYLYVKPPFQVGVVRQVHWEFLLNAANEGSVVNVLLQQFLL